jgi:hypothetical protein
MKSNKLMDILLAICLLSVIIISCKPEDESSILYQSDDFTIYKDKVVQGQNTASVLSPFHIKSNYKSPASSTFSRLIKFKFSINEKDNEMPPGQDHWVYLNSEIESPIVKFGKVPAAIPDFPLEYLPTNYIYTFKVDMFPVLNQFATKGYYECYDGTKIAANEFKGFYIAGGSEPLSWDFVNLDNKGLKLQSTDDPNIFSITLTFNPFDINDIQEKEWILEKDISNRPKYESDQVLVDALYNLSVEEAIKNIESDSTFRTGAKWGGVWTRDISYSIYLAFAYHEPEIAKISLRKKVKRGRIVQDTGSGGAWPVSSDRTTWVIAAWEIYKATGDEAWLDEIYPIIKNTLDDDYKTIYNKKSGMYKGESSFLDWREQTYPKWMSNMDIHVSENLSTNTVHYQALKILAEIAKIKNEDYLSYEQRADGIKSGMNNLLWQEKEGYYGQYLYGQPSLVLSPRFEALGESLAILFDVADMERAEKIIENSPITSYGATCIYPQIPDIPPYHNNGIWPFVQSYWNLAAAKSGNEKVLNHGLASIYRAGAMFLTNYENFVAQTGDFNGTEINSDRMLWSMAGNIAMVHRVFMGMNFELDGLYFNPVIPKIYAGKRTLSNFKYRNSNLKIRVNGYGNKIKTFKIDGKLVADHMISKDAMGNHTIEIELDNNSFDTNKINVVENHFSLNTPLVSKKENILSWSPIESAVKYNVYKNSKLIAQTHLGSYQINEIDYADYKISAVDSLGYESFTSQPITIAESKIIEIENFAKKVERAYTDFSGKGFVELSKEKNKILAGTLDVNKSGVYLLDLRYSNGSGPWNTDNKCAIRTVYINDENNGVIVMPQRGKDEWSDWGYTNSLEVKLEKGNNTFKIVFEEWNNNMNVDINTAMLDHIRLIRVN